MICLIQIKSFKVSLVVLKKDCFLLIVVYRTSFLNYDLINSGNVTYTTKMRVIYWFTHHEKRMTDSEARLPSTHTACRPIRLGTFETLSKSADFDTRTLTSIDSLLSLFGPCNDLPCTCIPESADSI